MTYHVLARKWRPQTFSDLVGQTHVVKALTFALSHNQVHHAYLLTGTRGVGKTSIARIFAKSLNCETNGVSAKPCGVCESCKEITAGKFVDLIEVDAASRTGVEETRELIDSVSYLPTKGRFKVYLIDEVHMFSKSSFNALLKTLEEPPEYVKFILATTDPEKLPITILSRCLQFNLKSLTQKQICQHLVNICEAENIAYDEQALRLLADAGDGSMRDTLSMTDQAIAYGQGELNLSAVTEILGTIQPADIEAILFAIATNNPNQLSVALHRLDNYEVDARAFLIEIMKRLQRMAWAKEGIAEQLSPALLSTVGDVPKPLLHLWYDIAEKALPNLSVSGNPREAVEMTLLRMLAFVPSDWLPRHRTVLDESLQSDETSEPVEQPIAKSTLKPVATPIAEPVQASTPIADSSATDVPTDKATTDSQIVENLTPQSAPNPAQELVQEPAPAPAPAPAPQLAPQVVEKPVDNSATNSSAMVNHVHASPVVSVDDLVQAEENFSHSYATDNDTQIDMPTDTASVSAEQASITPIDEKQQLIDNNLENSWSLSEESSNEPPPSADEINAVMKRGREIAPPIAKTPQSQPIEADKKPQENTDNALDMVADTVPVTDVDNPPWQTTETATDSLSDKPLDKTTDNVTHRVTNNVTNITDKVAENIADTDNIDNNNIDSNITTDSVSDVVTDVVATPIDNVEAVVSDNTPIENVPTEQSENTDNPVATPITHSDNNADVDNTSDNNGVDTLSVQNKPSSVDLSAFEWSRVVYQLGLTDYTLQFVSLGILRVEQQDNILLATLDLLPKNEVMATDDSLAELQTALQNHFQQTVQVKLNLTQIDQATPSEIQQQQQIKQQNDLFTTFEQEPVVQKVLEIFDGKIIEKTVKRTQ